MAMTDKERQDLKEGMKIRLKQHRQNSGSDKIASVIAVIAFAALVVVIINGTTSDDNEKSTATAAITSAPQYPGVTELEAKKTIQDFLKTAKHDFYYSGSLRLMNPHDFSATGGERSQVRKYNKLWVEMTNEVAIKSLTSGYCKKIEGARVITVTSTPTDPEIMIDCDNTEFEGKYAELLAGDFMKTNDYQQAVAKAYYASAPDAGASEQGCWDTLRGMLKNPETLDLYPTSVKEGVRPGKNGPEFFLSENFTSKSNAGLKIPNSFACSVDSQGHVQVTLRHS